LLAAVGFAVGMGNIWRFPYVLGENGGSAFLIIYLAFALGIGLPLLITEITIGRRGQSSATGSYRAVAAVCSRSRAWGHVGTLGIFCAFVILSYYTVISGWTLDYFVKAASGSLDGIDADSSSAMFSGLLNNPGRLLFWNTAVHILIIFVIRRGVQAGIESAVKILMPALFITLLIMVVYGIVAGDMVGAMKFLLEPDFSKVTFSTAMMAIGQAFFSIGIGMGSLVVFGARDISTGVSVWSGCRERRRAHLPDAAAGLWPDARGADIRFDILRAADFSRTVVVHWPCGRLRELG
jgi:NSS family neurotransmitter:Na+ symporter